MGGKKERGGREGDRGREERDCCHCVLPNLVNGFEGPGRQTNAVL